MDGTALLKSDDWTDNEWAPLTRSNPEEVIRVVFDKLRLLNGTEQQEAANSFVIVGGILGMEKEIERRFREEVIDIRHNQVLGPAIRQGLEQGRQSGLQEGLREGIAYALQTILESRFGPLPAADVSRIASATPDARDRWLHTCNKALSLEEVLQ